MYNRQYLEKLKKERKAVIVAHVYQPMEIQEIADLVGDSLQLSRFCAEHEAETIVFCGVLFMAESAKILSPEKTVLLPEIDAGCPMADMADVKSLRELKRKHQEATVVCYINSSAEVKAESDICCTSSNAVKIAESVENKKIIFVPDKNLGAYVASKVPDKEFIFWEGYCPVHNSLEAKTVRNMKQLHPHAVVAAHPECTEDVLDEADFIGSTKKIIDYVMEGDFEEYIIATEKGVVDRLKTLTDKKVYLVDDDMYCRDMKKITLEKVVRALEEDIYEIELDKKVIEAAAGCLKRMLAVV